MAECVRVLKLGFRDGSGSGRLVRLGPFSCVCVRALLFPLWVFGCHFGYLLLSPYLCSSALPTYPPIYLVGLPRRSMILSSTFCLSLARKARAHFPTPSPSALTAAFSSAGRERVPNTGFDPSCSGWRIGTRSQREDPHIGHWILLSLSLSASGLIVRTSRILCDADNRG